ncbi:carboxypeptidase-like regulatory domain-containing protein [Bremerella sp. JC770]|uniref:carboxypeptidase-like regulatory domain-containing protein n=1 Tax=Bremerella sp. JC770 TaxID=3232137 RepID=UPI0034585C46
MRIAAACLCVFLFWPGSQVTAQSPADEKLVTIAGRVIDENGDAVPDAAVTIHSYDDFVHATTDQEGQFRCEVGERKLRIARILADDQQGDRQGIFTVAYRDPPTADLPITITVEPSQHLPLEVTDADGAPAVGAKVGGLWRSYPLFHATTDDTGKATLRYPKNSPPDLLYAFQDGIGFDYRTVHSRRDGAYRAPWFDKPPIQLQLAEAKTVRFHVVDSDDMPVSGIRMQPWMLAKPGEPDPFNFNLMPGVFFPTSDADGMAEMRGFPTWRETGFTFFIYSQENSRGRYDIRRGESLDDPIQLVVDNRVPVRGQVLTADGDAVPHVEVAAGGDSHGFDGEFETATTDAAGHFEMQLRPHLLYGFTVRDNHWATPMVDGIVVRPKQPIDDLKLIARKPTRIFGKIVQGEDQLPAADQRLVLQQNARRSDQVSNTNMHHPLNQVKRVAHPVIQRSATTDAEGRYEFFVGPGDYLLHGSSQLKRESFTVSDQPEIKFNFTLDFPEERPLNGKVVAGQPPKPVADVVVELKYRASGTPFNTRLRTDDRGQFTLQRKPHGIDCYVTSKDGQLAAIESIADTDDTVTIELKPTATLTGTLINSITEKPMAGVKVSRYRPVYRDGSQLFTPAWGDSTTTDDHGKFTLPDLVVGQKYFLSCHDDEEEEVRYRGLPNYIPVEPGPHDLGEIQVTPSRRYQ